MTSYAVNFEFGANLTAYLCKTYATYVQHRGVDVHMECTWTKGCGASVRPPVAGVAAGRIGGDDPDGRGLGLVSPVDRHGRPRTEESSSFPDLVLDPNTAPEQVLMALPHAGPTLVGHLVEARDRCARSRRLKMPAAG